MQHIDIIIDNRISCSFIESSSIENVIFCRPLEESLDNVSIISTKDNEFIHSYIQESTNNYLETDIQLPDGRVYPNVRFKLVAVENGRELPQSTINLSSLGSHSSINEQTTLPNFIEEGYEFTVDNEKDIEGSIDELQTIPVSEDVSEYVEKVKLYEAHLIEEQARVKAEAQRLNRERIVLEDNRRIQKTLEDYKSELLHETFRISEQQKELLEQAINEAVESIQGQFDDQQINVGKYLETLSSANLEEVKKYQDNQVNEIKSSINSLLAERLEQASVENDKLLLERASELEAVFTKKIITELEEHKRNIGSEIDTITKSLDAIVTEKITSNNDNVDVLLVNRAGILQDQFSEKVATDLAEYKDNLSREFKASSTETASRIFSDKTKELNEAVAVLLDEHKQALNNTITDKLNTVGYSIDKFKSEVDGKLPELNNTIKDINKRIQSLVTEKKNVQLLVDDAKKYTDAKVAKVSEDVMTYARRILELGGGGGSNAVQYANGGTMNGDLNVTGQYLSGGVSLFNILSGSGGGGDGNPDVNALVISTSANWDTAYNISTVYASNSALYATTNYVDSNFLNLTGGLVSGPVRINNNLTVFGNLTATGTTTFANTVFSVTSALSVIHVGSDPAMYVGNSGDGDIASFYDLDQGIEILHVGGNNGSFPNVGVKTSTPNKTLTVAGEISATSDITTSGKIYIQGDGNSDQWNTAYQSISSQPYTFDPSVSSIDTVNGINMASGIFSGVLGGNRNTASGRYSTIVGGFSSCATGFSTFVGAGSGNRATGDYAVVGGGVTNSNFAPNSVIGGGTGNIICNNSNIPGNTIGGGLLNVIGSNATCANTIGGGGNNCANGRYATIAGGFNNLSNTFCTTVGGGASNQATGTFAVVGGGVFNCATSTSTTVAGGCCNCATSAGSTVAGGQNNRAIGAYSTVSGGYNNNASGLGAANGMTAIVGGRQNSTTTSSAYAFIGGGCLNVVGGVNSLIAGGLGNFNPLRDSIIGGGVANHTGGFAPFNITAAASISGNGTQTRLTGTGIQSLFSFPFTSGNVSLYYATPTVPLSSGTFTTATIAATGTNFIVVNGDYSTCTPTGLSATSIFVYDRAINNTGWNNTIAGGKLNTASGCSSFIGGGLANTSSGNYSFIGGGTGNIIFSSGSLACGNLIVGGFGNCITTGQFANTIVGGQANCLGGGQRGFIGGGINNRITGLGNQNTIVAGGGNTASGVYGTIVGGDSNSITTGNRGFIGAGCSNVVSANAALVVGGRSNTTSSAYSSTVGGRSNTTSSAYSSIVGGKFNYNPLFNSGIEGGSFNHTGGFAPNNITTAASISGNGTQTALIQAGIGSCFSASNTTGAVTLVWMTSGTANSSLSSANFTTANVVTNAANCIIINGDYSTCTATGLSACSIFVYDRCLNLGGCTNFIVGGILNTASGRYSFVGGGVRNTASSCYNFVGAGSLNIACGCRTAVVAGNRNTASSNESFIGGGFLNTASGYGSVLVGGRQNSSSGFASVVGGGAFNTASGTYSSVAGGVSNSSSACGTIVAGGRNNIASGVCSFIAGGSNNDTRGFANTFILGTALSASKANYTYVNNLSVQGNIESNTNYVATLSLTANQTANNASDTVVTLDPLNDPNNWFDRSTRRFTPTIPGYYHVDYQVAWGSGTAGSGNQNNIQIRRNTTSVALAQQPINSSNVNTTQNTADIAFLNGTTDYLEFTAYSSNAAQSIIGTSDGAWTKVEVFKIN